MSAANCILTKHFIVLKFYIDHIFGDGIKRNAGRFSETQFVLYFITYTCTSYLHLCASITTQYNLVPAKGG